MKNKKINVVFMLPTLDAGGAERVVSFISQHMDSKKFNVKLLITGYQKYAKFQTDNVETVFLNKKSVKNSVFGIFNFLIKSKNDIVFSSLAHLNITISFVSIFFPTTKFVARETFLKVGTEEYTIRKGKKIYSLINKISYRLLDYIVCQSEDMANDIKKTYAVPEKKLRILNNPITNSVKNKVHHNSSRINKPEITKFITVGRLSRIKGHIRILKLLAQINYPFEYTIIGSGQEKDSIVNHINSFKLNDKVVMIPHSNEVNKHLQASHYFLQGSYLEGFPNALLESCAVGTPAIAFKAKGGTREIIEQSVNGMIANDESEFLYFLKNLPKLDHKDVIHSVEKKFSEEVILNQYESFFKDIMNSGNP